MKKLFTVLVLFSITSCSLKFYPLKGHYPDTPIVYTTDKTFDQVWDNLVDLFAQNGISIRIIDRSSGLITSSKTILSTTYEDSKGKPYHPDAFIVLKRSNYQGDQNLKKSKFEVTGEWNVHLKKEGDKISLNINIANIEGVLVSYSLYKGEIRNPVPINAHTTGNFEKIIYQAIQK